MPLELGWLVSRSTRRAVADQIARGDDPHRVDLGVALDPIPGEPVPQEIIDYVNKKYVRAIGSIKPARRRRAAETDAGIARFHRMISTDLREREATTEVKRMADAETANEFKISARQVRRALAAHSKRKLRGT